MLGLTSEFRGKHNSVLNRYFLQICPPDTLIIFHIQIPRLKSRHIESKSMVWSSEMRNINSNKMSWFCSIKVEIAIIGVIYGPTESREQFIHQLLWLMHHSISSFNTSLYCFIFVPIQIFKPFYPLTTDYFNCLNCNSKQWKR